MMDTARGATAALTAKYASDPESDDRDAKSATDATATARTATAWTAKDAKGAKDCLGLDAWSRVLRNALSIPGRRLCAGAEVGTATLRGVDPRTPILRRRRSRDADSAARRIPVSFEPRAARLPSRPLRPLRSPPFGPAAASAARRLDWLASRSLLFGSGAAGAARRFDSRPSRFLALRLRATTDARRPRLPRALTRAASQSERYRHQSTSRAPRPLR